MTADTPLLLKPGLDPLLDPGRKLFKLLAVLLDFLLHLLLLGDALLLVADQFLQERSAVFALLLHLK